MGIINEYEEVLIGNRKKIAESNTIRIHGVWNLLFERNREIVPK